MGSLIASAREVFSSVFPEGAIAVVMIVTIAMALVVMPPFPEDMPGAGPVLLEALQSGWRPPVDPPRPGDATVQHECDMCGTRCCTKCNAQRDLCCCLNVTHCACPPDTWGDGSPELRSR